MARKRTDGERGDAVQAGGIEKSVREIREYWEAGCQSLAERGGRAGYKRAEIEAEARRRGWDPTKVRKARLFAAAYSERDLEDLFGLLRKHERRWPFGTSHIGVLVTIPGSGRQAVQQACIEGGWSRARLEDEAKKGKKPRSNVGRNRRITP